MPFSATGESRFPVHMPSAPAPSGSRWPDPWWRDAAIYQLYVRSFADGNGDGIGDLAGARAHLPYLAALGIDAIWFNPWYPSPMADAGYDISDYRSIDPVFGTLADADALIGEAHAHGIRIIIDVVPNHSSDRHPWFTEAPAARLVRARPVLVPPGPRRSGGAAPQQLAVDLWRPRLDPGHRAGRHPR